MSETEELQRFHNEYDNYANQYRDALQKNDLTALLFAVSKMTELDKQYDYVDKANDEHVETVLEDIEP